MIDTSDPSAPPRRAAADGRIADWEALEALLHAALYGSLGWEAGDEGFLLSAEPILTPRRDRERLAQLAFERFNVAGLFVADAPVLALYAVGKTSGVVVDAGHDKTDVACVVDGTTVGASCRRVPVGGAALEAVLARRLQEKGVGGERAGWPGALRRTVQACLTVLPSRDDWTALAARADGGGKSTAHTLPDGTVVEVSPADGAALGEALAVPGDASAAVPATLGEPPLGDAVVATWHCHTDVASRRAAFEALVACGGCGATPGLAERLVAAAAACVPAGQAPAVASRPEYLPDDALRFATWAGGAILARAVFQLGQHASRADYDEAGPGIVHRRGGC